MQSYDNIAAGMKRYIANDLLPVMDPGMQIAVGIGARYILANPDRMIEAVMTQFPVLGMLGAVDREKRTIDIEGFMPAAIEYAKEVGGFKIPLGSQQLTIPPEDIEKIHRYIMQGGA